MLHFPRLDMKFRPKMYNYFQKAHNMIIRSFCMAECVGFILQKRNLVALFFSFYMNVHNESINIQMYPLLILFNKPVNGAMMRMIFSTQHEMNKYFLLIMLISHKWHIQQGKAEISDVSCQITDMCTCHGQQQVGWQHKNICVHSMRSLVGCCLLIVSILRWLCWKCLKKTFVFLIFRFCSTRFCVFLLIDINDIDSYKCT